MEFAIVISIIIFGTFIGFAIGTKKRVKVHDAPFGSGLCHIGGYKEESYRFDLIPMIISFFTMVGAIFLVMCIGLDKISFSWPVLYARLAGAGCIVLAIALGGLYYNVCEENDLIMGIDSILNLVIIAIACNCIGL